MRCTPMSSRPSRMRERLLPLLELAWKAARTFAFIVESSLRCPRAAVQVVDRAQLEVLALVVGQVERSSSHCTSILVIASSMASSLPAAFERSRWSRRGARGRAGDGSSATSSCGSRSCPPPQVLPVALAHRLVKLEMSSTAVMPRRAVELRRTFHPCPCSGSWRPLGPATASISVTSTSLNSRTSTRRRSLHRPSSSRPGRAGRAPPSAPSSFAAARSRRC